MKNNIFKKILGLILIAFSVFVASEAYCFFPETVDAQEVKSALNMQKGKSKVHYMQTQENQIAQEVKKQQAKEEAVVSNGGFTAKSSSDSNSSSVVNKIQPEVSMVSKGFKRFKRGSSEQYQPQKQKMPPTVAVSEAVENQSSSVWPGISLLIVIIFGGMIWFKKKKE